MTLELLRDLRPTIFHAATDPKVDPWLKAIRRQLLERIDAQIAREEAVKNDTIARLLDAPMTPARRDALLAEVGKLRGAALEAVRALNCARTLRVGERSFGEISDHLARFL